MSKKHDKLAIGVDLGGTNIRASLVAPNGEILLQEQTLTPAKQGNLAPPSDLLNAIYACVHPLLSQKNILGIGIGSGGQFNPQTGVMLGIHTGDTRFVNVPFASSLEDRFSLPVFVDNDVKAAAFAELKCGSGESYNHIICVAVGTFIGGALILNGQLQHGASGLAGHLGQLMDFKTGQYIENIAGGIAMSNQAIRNGILQPNETTKTIFTLARSGNIQAQAFIHKTGKSLGIALAGIAHFIQPDIFLIGGSVGIQAEYLAAINSGLDEGLMDNWKSTRAIAMRLGTNAAQIGAALRVFEEIEG
jgi:glucokinase